jgi:hypothetical protein
MKKGWLIGLSAVLLLVASVGFSVTRRPSQLAPGKQATPTQREAAFYSAFFHMVTDLQKQALDLEKEGEKGESLRGYVQTQANLTDGQTRELNAIATACVAKVARQDAKAIQIIEKSNARFPEGKVPKGTKMPPPSPELKVLQQERDEIVLAAKDSLVEALGTAAFANVEQFAKRNITLHGPKR